MIPSSVADYYSMMNVIAADRHMRANITSQQHQQLHNNNNNYNHNTTQIMNNNIINNSIQVGEWNTGANGNNNISTSGNNNSRKSCNGTNSNSSSGSLRREKLSVVIPVEQKSLMTPNVCVTDTAAAAQHMFGCSFVQLGGQEAVSLFTGLPSCTPTSADKLLVSANVASMNPFFWGVTSASKAASSAPAAPPPSSGNQMHHLEDQQASLRNNTTREYVINASNNNNNHHQLSQQTQNVIALSPFSLWPYSPEADRLLRFQQQQQLVSQLNQHHSMSPISMMSASNSASSTSTIGGLQQQHQQQQYQMNIAKAAAETVALVRVGPAKKISSPPVSSSHLNRNNINDADDNINNDNNDDDDLSSNSFKNNNNISGDINNDTNDKISVAKDTNLSGAAARITKKSYMSMGNVNESSAKKSTSDTIKDQQKQQSQDDQLDPVNHNQPQSTEATRTNSVGGRTVSASSRYRSQTTTPQGANEATRKITSKPCEQQDHHNNLVACRILDTSRHVNPPPTITSANPTSQQEELKATVAITTSTTSNQYENGTNNNDLNVTNINYVCGRAGDASAATTPVARVSGTANYDQSRQHQHQQQLLQSSHSDQHQHHPVNNLQNLISNQIIDGDKRLSSSAFISTPLVNGNNYHHPQQHQQHQHHQHHHHQQQQQHLIYENQFKQFYPSVESQQNQQQAEPACRPNQVPAATLAIANANPSLQYAFAVPNNRTSQQFYLTPTPTSTSTAAHSVNQSAHMEPFYHHHHQSTLPTIRIEHQQMQTRPLASESNSYTSTCVPSGSSSSSTSSSITTQLPPINQDTQQQQHRKNTHQATKTKSSNSKHSKQTAKQQAGPSAACQAAVDGQQQEAEFPKKKSKGGRKKKLVTADELIARKTRSKERNRVAAKRCRQKRKVFFGELNSQIEKLQDENEILRDKLEALERHHQMCNV